MITKERVRTVNQMFFLNSAFYYCAIVVLLCTTSKARCVEERRSEKTFESERVNEKLENRKPESDLAEKRYMQ